MVNFKINSRPLFKLKNVNFKTRDFSPLILAGVFFFLGFKKPRKQRTTCIRSILNFLSGPEIPWMHVPNSVLVRAAFVEVVDK